MSVRFLIVDDEAPVRERVRALLALAPGVEIVGECRDGIQAVDEIRRLRPDAMTLDVQMPGLDGFAVLAHLEDGEIPVTIFVTSYDEHALRAFDVGAADYVLKPIAPARFRTALVRALARVRGGSTHHQESAVLRHRHQEGRWLERLVVDTAGHMRLMPLDTVRWLEGADNYVRVHTTQGSHLMRITLAHLETQLDPAHFLRVHRSSIVAIARVRAVEPGTHGDAVVTLDDGTEVRVARTRTARLRRRLRE